MGVRSFNVPQQENDRIAAVLAKTGLTFSELMRRWVDHGLQVKVLNEIVPSMSGKLEVNK